jgi:hypothetical protein
MKAHRALAPIFAGCLFVVAGGSHADDASHRQEVETLFRLTQMETKVDESVANVLDIQLRQNPGLVGHQALVKDFLDRHIGWEALKPDLVAMYLAAFTEDELRQMNAFYITPVGQKVLTRVPELVQQRNQMAMQRLQQNIGELQQAIDAAGSAQ